MFNCAVEISKFQRTEVALPGPERTAMRSRRNTNRTRLRNGLEKNGNPSPIGLHSQGSYAMRTMIQDQENDYDIDDGVYFAQAALTGPNGGELSALAVRQMVCAAVQDDRFVISPEVLKNCVRVYYNEGFHVDVPTYRRMEERDKWTGKISYYYELASSIWKRSDPLQVTKWFKSQNEALSGDFATTEGQFARVVKLTKKFARSRTSWKGSMATGFMITKLVSELFRSDVEREDRSLRQTLQAVADRLSWNQTVQHPTIPGENISKPDDARPEYFRSKLADNLKHLEILDNPQCTHSQAMGAWDKFFNTEWFTAQPAPAGGTGAGSSGEKGPAAPVQKIGGGRYAVRSGL